MLFMPNLAFPDSKFPAEGVNGRVDTAPCKYSVIGGACVARSTDGGISKPSNAYQITEQAKGGSHGPKNKNQKERQSRKI
jgi:hypothetical protein